MPKLFWKVYWSIFNEVYLYCMCNLYNQRNSYNIHQYVDRSCNEVNKRRNSFFQNILQCTLKRSTSLKIGLHIEYEQSKTRILEHRLTIVTVFSILTASQTDPINVITNSIVQTIPIAEVSASFTIVSWPAFCFEYK